MLNKDFIKGARIENLRRRYPLSEDTSFGNQKMWADFSHEDEIQEECIVTFPMWLEGNVVEVDTQYGKRKAIIVSVQEQEGDKPFERLWFPDTFRKSYRPYVYGQHQPPIFNEGEVVAWFERSVADTCLDKTIQLLLNRKVRFSDTRIGQYLPRSIPFNPQNKEFKWYTLFNINWADGRGNPNSSDFAQLIQQFDVVLSEIQAELSDFDEVREEHAALLKERREWEVKFNQLKEIIGK